MSDLEQRIEEAEAEYEALRREWLDARAKRQAAHERLKSLYRERSALNRKEPNLKRFVEAFEMRQIGATYRAIAQYYGVSETRAGQLVRRGERLEQLRRRREKNDRLTGIGGVTF